METRVMAAHIPVSLADKVDAMAVRLDRTREWIIKEAFVDWIADEEERNQLTLEALTDVRAGRVIDDDVVRAWIESLDTDSPLPAPGSWSGNGQHERLPECGECRGDESHGLRRNAQCFVGPPPSKTSRR